MELRRRLLSEEGTFEKILELGMTLEEVQRQDKVFNKKETSTIAAVRRTGQPRGPDNEYDNCGFAGHWTTDTFRCPAASGKRLNGQRIGHVWKMLPRGQEEDRLS